MKEELLRLADERQRVRDCLSRCDDLGGQMLLTGKLKALHREEDALRASVKEQNNGK